MRLPFHILDVFTERPFGGNPLAVVHGAEVLTDAQMQKIAREFNLSETVFVFPPDNPAHSVRIRIFTPFKELPFAGHPTVGTAALIAHLKFKDRDSSHMDALIALEETVGILRVGVRLRGGHPPFAEFDAPRLPEEGSTLAKLEVLAAALGLIPNEIGFENHKPVSFATAGSSFAFIPIGSRATLSKARPCMDHWSAAFHQHGLIGAYLYTRQCEHISSAFHVRMFAPDVGIPEDPATGSAALCFARVIKLYDDLPDGSHKRILEQGFEIERPSFLSLVLQVEAQKLSGIRVGGHAVRVGEGTLEF